MPTMHWLRWPTRESVQGRTECTVQGEDQSNSSFQDAQSLKAGLSEPGLEGPMPRERVAFPWGVTASLPAPSVVVKAGSR